MKKKKKKEKKRKKKKKKKKEKKKKKKKRKKNVQNEQGMNLRKKGVNFRNTVEENTPSFTETSEISDEDDFEESLSSRLPNSIFNYNKS